VFNLEFVCKIFQIASNYILLLNFIVFRYVDFMSLSDNVAVVCTDDIHRRREDFDKSFCELKRYTGNWKYWYAV